MHFGFVPQRCSTCMLPHSSFVPLCSSKKTFTAAQENGEARRPKPSSPRWVLHVQHNRYLVPAKLASCKVNSQIIFSQLFKVWMSLTLRGDYGLRPSTETWKRRSTFLREVCDPFAIHFNNFPQESALIYAITMDTHHSTTPHMQARWKCVSSSSLTTRT